MKTSITLPLEARLKLQKAAETKITKSDPLARRRAIDEAIDWATTRFPECFVEVENLGVSDE